MFRTWTKLLLQIATTAQFPVLKHLQLFFSKVRNILVNVQDTDKVSNFKQWK